MSAYDKEPLPLRGIAFLEGENNDKIVITRGASLGNPELVLRDKTTAGWVYKGPISAGSGASDDVKSKFGGALQKFQEISLKGSRNTNDNSQSVHSHTISEIRSFEKNAFITSGFDGQIVFWYV